MQYSIKSEITLEINLGINTEAETIITINKKDISTIDWKEKGKEMVYNNKRYDVIKQEENKTSVTYYCVNDKQEEQLFSDLDEHIHSHIMNTPIKNHSQKNSINDVVKVFYQNNYSFIRDNTSTDFYFNTTNSVYTSVVIETNSPPPEHPSPTSPHRGERRR